MCDEVFLRLVFLGLWLFFLGIRSYYGRKAQPASPKRTREERWAIATQYEHGVFVVLRVVLMVVLILSVVIYAFVPSWLEWAQLPIPACFRWIGVAMAIITFPFLIWVGRTLGKHVTGQLELREDHQLITTGPYSRIRHPLYLVYLVFNVVTTLIAANWVFFFVIVAGLLLLYPRINAEESMLIEEFGEQYRVYMLRAGMLFPRIRRAAKESQDSS
ncbi:MAG: isoprenylcysteine carboxylmethyltransferase family protein [Promethearchaeota archaeon]